MHSNPELLKQIESALGVCDHQLRSAVTSITATFQQKLAAGPQSGRQFILPTLEEQVAAKSEFKLLTWHVILSP